MQIRSIPTSMSLSQLHQTRNLENDAVSNSLASQPQEKIALAKLRARDRKVRAHEQAHQAAASGLVSGGANFTFERGPDGKQYAVGGEVHIDTAPVAGDPEATIRKARQIRAAALAPADPSPQDRAVAAQAAAMEAQAKQELAHQQRQKDAGSTVTSAARAPRIDLYV